MIALPFAGHVKFFRFEAFGCQALGPFCKQAFVALCFGPDDDENDDDDDDDTDIRSSNNL